MYPIVPSSLFIYICIYKRNRIMPMMEKRIHHAIQHRIHIVLFDGCWVKKHKLGRADYNSIALKSWGCYIVKGLFCYSGGRIFWSYIHIKSRETKKNKILYRCINSSIIHIISFPIYVHVQVQPFLSNQYTIIMSTNNRLCVYVTIVGSQNKI